MAMENVLKCLVRDSQALGRGFTHIKQQSQAALELLESQTGLLQSTPHELREKSLTALHSALVSNSGHLLRLALMGVQKMLRDNSFISKHCDPPDDRQWLLSQLLGCLLFPNWSKVTEEVQVEICRIYISFACIDQKYLNLNARVIVDLLTRCLDMGLSGGVRSRKHHVALQTASVQNLQAFAKYLTHNSITNKELPNSFDLNQAIPIIQFLSDKLEDGLVTSQSFCVEFCLESIHALLSNLPDETTLNSRSHSFVWRTLCPTLLKLVGVPLPNVPITEHRISELRCVASIGCELLRLFGNVTVLRAPLESLFHRLLVTNHAQTRIEVLKVIKQFVASPQRLIVIGGPFLVQVPNENIPEPNEFGILRIFFDGMEESMQQSDSTELKALVVHCANTILITLLSLTSSPSSDQLSDPFMEKINWLYPDLESCDYIGALSYPSRLRMPKTYEQLLKDQNAQTIKPPTVTIDFSHLEEVEVEDHRKDDDNHSTTSGVTEGPEALEDHDISDREVHDDIELFGNYEVVRSSHVDLERKSARKFLQDLQTFLPCLRPLRSPLEVDLALQKFASDYCEDAEHAHVVFNADGIYLAAYATLMLNFELAKRDYYPARSSFVTQSEDDFIASVLNSGILVYLTPEFLAELYQEVLISDVIGNAGYSHNADPNAPLSTCAFINLLTDVRQVKSAEQASCFLSDCRKLHFAFTPSFVQRDPRRLAGQKFARRLLTCFWDSFLFVYSQGVSSANSELGGEDVSPALEGLQNAAKLSTILGLQDRSGTIFSLLASVACGNPRLGSVLVQQKSLKNRLTKARLANLLSKPVLDIDVPHILSLDVVLNKGLELASYNKEAWTHILRCCLYVTELERRLYQSRQSDRFKVTSQLKQYTTKLKWKLSPKSPAADDLNLASSAFGGLDDETSTDSYGFLTAASQLPGGDNDIQQLLEKAVKSDGYKNSGQLDNKLVSRIVSLLSERVDLLMEDAAAKLNLKSLLLLIEELCQLCHVQLSHLDEENITLQCHWVLHRIGEVMLRSVKTGRPLYHALHCWAMVGPTLLKAACSSDPAVAKTSVEILRSVISHVLQEQPEPHHFHFNEALFKPFEQLLCRENCDSDLQDQVMSSLCELVGCWSSEIRSGWRPLFACLRRWPPPPQDAAYTCCSNRLIHSENISNVKGILAAFVQHVGNSALIFANAAMDAILCQLHYLKCYRYVAELSEAALRHIQKFAKILTQLCKSNQIPIFYSAMSLTFLPKECDFEVITTLASEHRELIEAEDPDCWAALFEVPRPDASKTLLLWDNPTGIYKAFYLLIDGITCMLPNAVDPIQKSIGEAVMATLTQLIEAQEYQFAALCLRCSIVPSMTHWLASVKEASQNPHANCVGTFKQVCGLLSEITTSVLTVEHHQLEADEVLTVFREVVLFYVQCAVQEDEALVRIGNSCFRHIVFNSAARFEKTEWEDAFWNVVVTAFDLIVRCNLSIVQRLIQEDRIAEEYQQQQRNHYRLQHLSQQIFSQGVAESFPPTSGCKLFVALLSCQLAVNSIANIVCYSNSILSGEERVISEAAFVENMQKFVKVKTKALAGLGGVLRGCCDFGIDFETALGMRQHLQKLFGFHQPPSLSQFTALCSDLMLVALCNVARHSPRHMRELEQWLDFLIDFCFEESGHGLRVVPPPSTACLRTPPELRQMSAKSRGNVISYASSVVTGSNSDLSQSDAEEHDNNKPEDATQLSIHQQTRGVTSSANDITDALSETGKQIICHPDISIPSSTDETDASNRADTEDSPLENGLKRETEEVLDCPNAESDETEAVAMPNCPILVTVTAKEEFESARSSNNGSKEDVTDKGSEGDDDELVGEQIAAALENYRRQKRIQARKHFSLPNSPKMEKQPSYNFSRGLLLSALRMLSRVGREETASFCIVWGIVTRIRLHSTDGQLRRALEELETKLAQQQDEPSGELPDADDQPVRTPVVQELPVENM